MKHIWYLARATVVVTLLFVVSNYVTFPLLKAAISDSKFRAVVAANAARYIGSGQQVTLFIGNSRIMGGIDPESFGYTGEVIYNLAYNGLYLDDLRLLLDAFIRTCDCKVKHVYANPDIFRVREAGVRGVSELQRFLSGFDPTAFKAVQQRDVVGAGAMRLFPLLHFNNEFFLRALYYRVSGKDDQDYASDYKITINREMERRLQGFSFEGELDISSVQDLRDTLAESGIRLTVIEPPYHRVFLENVQGFDAEQAGIKAIMAEAGVSYSDHSGLFYDRPELFSDPLHVNRAGQREYSRYILDVTQLRDKLQD